MSDLNSMQRNAPLLLQASPSRMYEEVLSFFEERRLSSIPG